MPGDLVGYPGGNPLECVEIVRARCSLVVKGNHDAGVAGGELAPADFADIPGAEAAIERIRHELEGHPRGDVLRTYLYSLPLERKIDTGIGPIVIVHASPFNQLLHNVSGAGAYWQAFNAMPDACLVLAGHTHRGSFCIRTPDGRLDFTEDWERRACQEGLAPATRSGRS